MLVLAEALHAAQAGSGTVAFVLGEPGAGKSRLAPLTRRLSRQVSLETRLGRDEPAHLIDLFAAAVALSSLSVETNARRLRRYHPAPLSAGETVTAEPRVRPAPGSVTARNAREPGHRTRAPQHRNRHRLVLLR